MEVKNRRAKSFRDLYAGLPEKIKEQARIAFQIFVSNPDHPSLRRHPLKDNGKGRHKKGSISVSVTMQYRAIYVAYDDRNVWYWIGTHNDYNSFIGS